MNNHFINIGFGNLVNRDKIIAVVSPEGAPVRRLIPQGKEQQRVVDATAGRRTKAVIICEGDRMILAALGADTIGKRTAEEQKE